MPIYEYRCEKCGDFEEIQKITENSLTECPTCKGKIERLISKPAIIFKGSGFHINDYKKSDKASSSTPSSKPIEKKPAESNIAASKETKSSPKDPSPSK